VSLPSAPSAAPPDVPERYRGVWRRSLLETPAKPATPAPTESPTKAPRQRDAQTWVRWLQTASWHADLRVPAAARPPSAPGHPGARPTPLQLAAQQGFLGRTRVELGARVSADGLSEAERGSEGMGAGLDICTWERQLDFQPPGLHPDAGRIEFDGPDRLIETGVHGDYLEHWERLPDSIGRHAVLERWEAPAEGRSQAGPAGPGGGSSAAAQPEWLLLSGAFLMRVRPRLALWPADTQPGDSLEAVLQGHPAQQAALLGFEIAFGRLQEGCWIVEKATSPGLEGTVHPLQLRRTGETEALVNQGRLLGSAGRWRVHEWSAAGELLL
jgi:hypothetical protein